MALRVGLAATKEQWSAALRSYLTDHTQGTQVEVVMDGPALRRVMHRIDVFIIDDVMRTFSVADVTRARGSGIHVIGLSGQSGMGRQHLMALGADEVMAASVPVAELAAAIAQLPPRQAVNAASTGARGGLSGASPAWSAKRRSRLTAWTKVSGGAGLTELVIGVAEQLAGRGPALLVEAEELCPVLASRLARSPECGLPWALGRAREGLPAVRQAISGPRGDGTPPVGRFDLLAASPGAAQPLSAAQLEKVLHEASALYDNVAIETGWLVGAPSSRERFSSVRLALQLASAIFVVAAADPEGAARLVQWKASALAAEISAPCWAVFGRAPTGRYQRQHLKALVEANSGRHRFAGTCFVPEDSDVQRARWNAELLRKGAWHKAVRDLAAKATTTKDVVAMPTAVRPLATGKWPSEQAARIPLEVPVPL